MKVKMRKLGISLISFGLDPRKIINSLKFLFGYVSDILTWLKKTSKIEREEFPLRLLPTLSDKYSPSGVASGHYFHQDLWVARKVKLQNPIRHVDIGSRIDGFVAHLLCFMNVEVIDIRSLVSKISGLTFFQADMMAEKSLNIEPSKSVSSLHALEHFGLGRYGDPITPDGWRIGIKRMAEIVAPDGRLYLSVPIGEPAVEFNAQRIFHPQYIILEAEVNGLTLIDFAFVDDNGDLHELKTPIHHEDISSMSKMQYGCGIFVFYKIN
jgi:hypothetical protein